MLKLFAHPTQKRGVDFKDRCTCTLLLSFAALCYLQSTRKRRQQWTSELWTKRGVSGVRLCSPCERFATCLVDSLVPFERFASPVCQLLESLSNGVLLCLSASRVPFERLAICLSDSLVRAVSLSTSCARPVAARERRQIPESLLHLGFGFAHMAFHGLGLAH